MTKGTGGIAKVSSDGALVWSKPYGSLVAVSANDDVFVAGTFTGTLELDDATTLVASGGSDAFVAVLDVGGNVKRATALGTGGDDTATSLAANADGAAIVAGDGIGTLALDGDGKIAWQKEWSGALATDANGNVFVTGGFSGSRNFGGGTLTSAGGDDVFVVELDADGNHVLSRAFGDAGAHQAGQAIAVDAAGNLLIAGVFDGALDFGTGALQPAKCPAEAWCKTSGFVAKLDGNGTALWSRSRGAMRAVSAIATTSSAQVLVSGAQPGDAEPYRMPFLAALDADGDKLWQRTEWPETGLGAGRGLAVDGCDQALWSVSARPSQSDAERGYLAKILP